MFLINLSQQQHSSLVFTLTRNLMILLSQVYPITIDPFGNWAVAFLEKNLDNFLSKLIDS